MEARNTHLFVAQFADGNIINQTHEDKSKLVEGGNCYTDVLHYDKMSPMVSFGLVRCDKVLTYVVSMLDGHFEINQKVGDEWIEHTFWQHRRSQTAYKDFRGIYFRITGVTMQQTSTAITPTRMSVVGYVIGWQTTFKGKNVQRIMRV